MGYVPAGRVVFCFCGFDGFVAEASDMEKLLNIKELAERLGISHLTAYHWLSEGRLKCVRFSRRCVRFRESDVLELLQQLTDAGQNVTANEQLYTKVLGKQRQR